MRLKRESVLTQLLINFSFYSILPYTIFMAACLVYYCLKHGTPDIKTPEGELLVYGGFAFAAVSILIMCIGLFFSAKKISDSLGQLVKTSREFLKGNHEVKIEVSSSDEIGDLQKSFINFSKVFSEREKMKSTFSRYISDYIADEILTDGLGGQFIAEYRNVTILFSDIRGFTTLSEGLEPKELLDILNNYFDQMIDIVLKNNGVINKFIGDAIMVLYNAPKLCEHSEIYAILTAFEMNRALREFNNRYTKKYGISLEIGIGINSGQVVAGNVGSEKRMEYTVIGDNVNISSRLQTVAKGGEIAVSENVARYARYAFNLTDLGEIELKGKKQPLRVHKVGEMLPVETIKQNLKSDDPEICYISMIVFSRLEKINLDSDLMPLLKNQFEKVRVMALDLIIERYKPKAEECIMYILQNDKSEFVKVYAIDQVGKLGLGRFINFLPQYITAESTRLRGAVISCLQRLNDTRLKERIISSCKFETEEITREIAKALNKYPKLSLYETIETMLLEESGIDEQKLGVYILCNLGISARVDILTKLFMEAGADDLRKLVVSAFLKIGSCKTVIYLLKNLNKFEKETLNNAYKIIAHLISKYHGDEYKFDAAVQIQLDIIKSLILSSEGKNFEKLKVALIKNK